MTNSNELLPCPLCGGEAYFDKNFWGIACTVCNIQTLCNPEWNKGEVEAEWNTRAPVRPTATNQDDSAPGSKNHVELELIRRLEREIEVLRQYGNKECTAQADLVLQEEKK